MAKACTIQYSTEGLSRAEVIVLLVNAFRTLKWGVEHLHPMRVVANVPWSAWSYGEVVSVEFNEASFIATCKFDRWSPLASKKRLQKDLDRMVEAFAEARVSINAQTMAAELKELEESGVMQLDASTSHSNEFKWKDIGSFFIPTKEFWATPLLIDISILVYILMVATGVHFMEPTSEQLLAWGANYRPATLGGDFWRLLTCCFVHIGVIHLVFNMYAMAMAGVYLEPMLGRWRVIALYVVTGVAASLASLWWHENTVSAGASGAIFGLYGVFLALLTTDLMQKDVRKQMLMSIGVFVGYNLLYGLKSGVDNAAHMGGLAVGLLCGFALYPSLRKPESASLKTLSLAAPAAAVFLVAAMMLFQLRNDDLQYEQRMEAFFPNQEVGMAIFAQWDAGATDADLLQEVEQNSLPAWRANDELLDALDDLKVSDNLARQHVLYHRYCDLRVASFELAQLLFNGSDDVGVRAEFERTLAEINVVILEMNGPTDEP